MLSEIDGVLASSAIRGIVRPSLINCDPRCNSARDGLMMVVDPRALPASSLSTNPERIGAVVATASILLSYPSDTGSFRHRSTKELARAGGFLSHCTKVFRGSQADTTIRAVTVAPSLVCTALTRCPSHTIPITRVFVRSNPP